MLFDFLFILIYFTSVAPPFHPIFKGFFWAKLNFTKLLHKHFLTILKILLQHPCKLKEPITLNKHFYEENLMNFCEQGMRLYFCA